MSEENTQDEKSAIARAELLFTTGAPPDWIIVTKEEVAVIKAELAETKAKLEAAERISEGRRKVLEEKAEELKAEWKRAENAEAKLAKAVAALEDAEKEVEFWKREANSITEQLNDLQNHNAATALREVRGGKDA